MSSDKEILSLINNCKPYINLLQSSSIKPFSRAVGRDITVYEYLTTHTHNDDYAFKQKILQTFIDSLLKSLSHISRLNNTVYVASSISSEFKDKNEYYIFVSGNFDYSFVEDIDFNSRKNPINKLNSVLINVLSSSSDTKKIHETWTDYSINLDFENFKNKMLQISNSDYINDDLEELEHEINSYKDYLKNKVHTNTNVKTAYSNGYETWFKCEGYYLVNKEYYTTTLQPILKSLGYNF